MNIFQKSIKEKTKKAEKLRMAHSLVSAEITKLIEIEPTTENVYSFDQIDGYSFHNEKRTLPSTKWNVSKIVKTASGSSNSEETHWREIDYTNDDEVAYFFHALSKTLAKSAE